MLLQVRKNSNIRYPLYNAQPFTVMGVIVWDVALPQAKSSSLVPANQVAFVRTDQLI